MGVGLVRSLRPPDILWIHWRVYNFIANTSKRVLFLPPSDAYVRSFFYLLYTLIKLYFTKALSDQASSLAPDWILLLWGPRIPVSSCDSTTTFHLQLRLVPIYWSLACPTSFSGSTLLINGCALIDIQFVVIVQKLSRVGHLWHHGLQHTGLPCPSPTSRASSNSCPSSWWCHPTNWFSVIHFYSCLQSFPASGSFPKSQFFTSGGQSIGASASASVLLKCCCWRTKRHWDSWPPEEKNSILGQRQGLIMQSFCAIEYKRDRESFWHRRQKGVERVPPITMNRKNIRRLQRDPLKQSTFQDNRIGQKALRKEKLSSSRIHLCYIILSTECKPSC